MTLSQSPLKRLAGAAPSRVGVVKAGFDSQDCDHGCQISALARVGIEETINEDAYEAWLDSKESEMATYKFESTEQTSKIFDCRYALRRPCTGNCPLGIDRATCEAVYFLGMEGRPACGDRFEIGDKAVETRERPEGGADVVEEQL